MSEELGRTLHLPQGSPETHLGCCSRDPPRPSLRKSWLEGEGEPKLDEQNQLEGENSFSRITIRLISQIHN